MMSFEGHTTSRNNTKHNKTYKDLSKLYALLGKRGSHTSWFGHSTAIMINEYVGKRPGNQSKAPGLTRIVVLRWTISIRWLQSKVSGCTEARSEQMVL